MVERESAEDRLKRLREIIATARSMPMSASCVINRGEVLTVIDDIIDHLPDEIAAAQEVIDATAAKVTEGEAEAAQIVADAKEQAAELAEEGEIVKAAKERAAKLISDAEAEAAALRKETDLFIDSRMASFESVLHKTTSQVKTARARLAERSGLDTHAV
jgi:regulator of protease activity HflC (stomatin/prohibitin superfamily)